MKLCILGNSHAAALKHGWDRIDSEYPEVDVDIFSMRGQNMAELELVGHTLSLADTSKYKMHSFPHTAGSVIDLKSYDGFILHGLGLKVGTLPDAVYSRACREHAIVDAVKATALWAILSDIRKVSDVKTVVGHSPLRAARKVQSIGPSANYSLYLDEMNEYCFSDLASTVIAQPESMIVNGCMTDPKYNADVVSLNKEGIEESGTRHSDLNHMNPAFGVEMLRQFLGEFSHP